MFVECSHSKHILLMILYVVVIFFDRILKRQFIVLSGFLWLGDLVQVTNESGASFTIIFNAEILDLDID